MKKLGLLLASLGAGLLLVGGTVAAYIVTSADTLGARVSPGNLDEDADGHITLKWESKVITNVSNLKVGDDPAEVARVELGAESEDIGATPAEITSKLDNFTGEFKVEITNQSNPGVGVADLRDFLDVKTYKYVTSDYDYEHPVISGAGTYGAKRGDKYQTKVSLKAQSSGETPVDTASVFDIISNQVVYVSFSWGPDASSADVENVRTVYFVNNKGFVDDAENDIYFYAYKGTTVNKSFPGVKMNKVYQTVVSENTYDVYAVEFDASKYTNYNFNNGTHANEVAVAAPETPLTSLAEDATPGYVPGTGAGTGWVAKPNEKLAQYYIRGSIGGVDYWNAYAPELALVQNSEPGKEDEYMLTGLSFHSGDEIKIYRPSDGAWFGPNDNWKITSDSDNYMVCVRPGHEAEGWSNGMWCGIPA